MEKQILPIGNTLKTGKNGYLIKNADIDKIQRKWKDAVNELVESCEKIIGEENLHSIWIRGSVANGLAKENPSKEDSSDLDSIILTKCDIKEINKYKIKSIKTQVKEKLPFIEKVEIPIKNYKEILEKERYKHWRAMLKLMSVCVYGIDISDKLENFKPDKKFAQIMSIDLEEIIQKAKEKIESHPKKTKQWCKWAMNKIVRQGFILVLEKEKTFTRDLWPCYKAFSKHYEEKEPEMKKALELAIYPTENKEEIFKTLDNLGTWVAEESKRQKLT